MKRLLILSAIMLLLGVEGSFAQSKYGILAKDSWSFGFGVTYPRYISTDVAVMDESGYGGYLSIQRNFSEHIGFRLEGNYIHLQGKVGNNTVNNNAMEGNFDLLYYFVPCEPISPYLGVGIGGFYNTIDNSPVASLNTSTFDYQMNLRFGAEWRLSSTWNLKTELGYHTPASSKFDGNFGTVGGGILGGYMDSYMTFDLGFVYYFSKGEKSNLCELYDGLSPKIDYDKIEDIVKKYATKPTEIDYNRIEDLIKKHSSKVSAVPENWVLIGVNFDFNKASIRPESLPILYNAAEILLTHPEVKVEIQGYTDNVGSDKYNKQLSLRRADAVKNFLVAKGVNSSRLTTAGYGESNPIANNKTADGRALNRRIEFKVIQ